MFPSSPSNFRMRERSLDSPADSSASPQSGIVSPQRDLFWSERRMSPLEQNDDSPFQMSDLMRSILNTSASVRSPSPEDVILQDSNRTPSRLSSRASPSSEIPMEISDREFTSPQRGTFSRTSHFTPLEDDGSENKEGDSPYFRPFRSLSQIGEEDTLPPLNLSLPLRCRSLSERTLPSTPSPCAVGHSPYSSFRQVELRGRERLLPSQDTSPFAAPRDTREVPEHLFLGTPCVLYSAKRGIGSSDGREQRGVSEAGDGGEMGDVREVFSNEYFIELDSNLLKCGLVINQIKNLILGYIDTEEFIARMIHEQKNIPALLQHQALSTETLDIDALAKKIKCTSLRDSFQTSEKIARLLTIYSNLTCVKLPFLVDDLHCNEIRDNIGRLRKLKRLDCSQFRSYLSDEMLSHASGLPQLTSLDLRGAERITDVGIGHLPKYKTLTELSLRNNESVTDDTLQKLSTLEKLVYLDLSHCEHITDIGLSYLRECPRHEVSDDCRDIVRGSPIQFLSIAGCKKITDAGIQNLKGLDYLRTLNLAGCPEVTVEGINYLIRTMGSMERIVVGTNIDLDALEKRPNLTISQSDPDLSQ